MGLRTTFDTSQVFLEYVARNADYAASLIEAASAEISRAKLTVALQALQFTLASNKFWPQSRRLLLALAPEMEALDLRPVWQPYLERGLRQSIDLKDEEAELELRYYLGNLRRETGQYNLALVQYDKALELARKLGRRDLEISLLNRYAFTLRRKGDLEQAEEAVREALALMGSEKTMEMGYSYLVLGSIRYDQQRFEECLDYSHMVLDIWEGLNEKKKLPWAYANLGAVLIKLGEFEKANYMLRKGIQHFQDIGDTVHQASTKINLAAALIANNQAEEAIVHLTEAEKVFRNIQDEFRLAMVANNMAHAYTKLGNWDQAITAFQQSISLWDFLEEPARALDVIHSLAMLFVQLGRYEEARALYNKAMIKLNSVADTPKFNYLRKIFAELQEKLANAESS